jgi:hypothetical protein
MILTIREISPSGVLYKKKEALSIAYAIPAKSNATLLFPLPKRHRR